MGRHRDVPMTNDAAPGCFGCGIDMAPREGPRNLPHPRFARLGMQPFVADRGVVSRSLLRRLHRESVGPAIDDAARQLLDARADAPGNAQDALMKSMNARSAGGTSRRPG
ncbi:hypothetical protein LGM41_08145 [Burkholderia seminalis]|nr:hypothetical protein [Burkholderia seminalis]KVF45602.1 hypothetical protein WJ13_25340 [Burkholderia seminalis]MCA8039677.1 hypothetical protein [Burkholderia seminalis]MDN7849098.1 hypothetical protein [Burkholderia seminalis]